MKSLYNVSAFLKRLYLTVLLFGSFSPVICQAQGLEALIAKTNSELAAVDAVLNGQSSFDDLYKDLRIGRGLWKGVNDWSRAQTTASMGHYFWSVKRGNEAVAMFDLADQLTEKALHSRGQLQTNRERAHAFATRADIRKKFLRRDKQAEDDWREAEQLDPENQAVKRRAKKRETENGKGGR